jgi:myo-inositol-1(or 4)-monophosphatase
MDLQKLCGEIQQIVKETGKFIAGERESFNNDKIEKKGDADFVSYVDKSAEKMLVEKLGKLLPESGFIAEEGTSSKRGERYNWIIDPLDGTTNFIHGVPPFAVSVALAENNNIILGVIYEITQDECFYAWEGDKSYLNGKEIKVSDAATTGDSLIATGFPYYDFSRLDGYMNLMLHFMKNSHGIRRIGSAATDLAYVAAGRYDAFWEYSLHPWDVAAGIIIVKQAGGKVGDFSGGDNCLFGKEIVASNGKYFKEFQEIVNKYQGVKSNK